MCERVCVREISMHVKPATGSAVSIHTRPVRVFNSHAAADHYSAVGFSLVGVFRVLLQCKLSDIVSVCES